ncbi:MAG: hypothetical protein INR62_00395 [Rhodospirillales bacterium]|nr:hypothetical protein [Acetobacter sp.]
MKRSIQPTDGDAGQMLFTYRRSLAERLASGDLRDASTSGKTAGFRWPLAVTRRLWDDVEAVPAAYRRTETAKARWQHLFVLTATAAAQMRREGKPSAEINVVLRTTDAPERSREHVKALTLRWERDDAHGAALEMFTLGYHGE